MPPMASVVSPLVKMGPISSKWTPSAEVASAMPSHPGPV